jgi:molecular chaperone GrpE
MSMEENQATQTPGETPETAAAAQAASQTTGATPGHDAAATPPGAAGPDAALAELEGKLAKMQEDYLRAKAETDNVRKRAQEDVEKTHKFAIERFAEHLLPVLDSLEAAATDTSGDLAKVREGVELTLRQLNSALEKGRVAVINPIGEKFDPHRHQAISMVPSEQESNTVVAVLQKGYLIAERVLRPALVTVSAPK